LLHGRLAIGDGAVKKGTIIDAAKASGEGQQPQGLFKICWQDMRSQLQPLVA